MDSGSKSQKCVKIYEYDRNHRELLRPGEIGWFTARISYQPVESVYSSVNDEERPQQL